MVTQYQVDLQLLYQKVEWLCKELKEHMEYEEKQRDKIEEQLVHLDRKLNKILAYGTALMVFISGGTEVLTALPM